MSVEGSHKMEIVNTGTEPSRLLIPMPRLPITVRPATLADLPFIDALQKKNSKQVGFMQTAALEGKIKAGNVLIAEEPSPLPSPCVQGEGEGRVGYCIGDDQDFKSEVVGVIYPMDIGTGRYVGVFGAKLLTVMFV